MKKITNSIESGIHRSPLDSIAHNFDQHNREVFFKKLNELSIAKKGDPGDDSEDIESKKTRRRR
jgi:hypothetical protein